jgi:hypothetical protein
VLGDSPLSSTSISELGGVNAGSGIAACAASSTAVATGQTLNTHGAGTATGTCVIAATGVSIVVASGSVSAGSTTDGAIQSLKQIVGVAAGTSSTSFKLGDLRGGAAAATGTSLSSGVSSVEARAVTATGQVSGSVVGAWDGPSGGDANTTTTPGAAATGESFAIVQATATGASSSSGVATPIAAASLGASAESSATAEAATVKPMYGNGIMQWYDQPVVGGVSEVVDGLEVRAGAGVSDCTWLVEAGMFGERFVASVATATAIATVDGRGAISGDAIAASSGLAAAIAAGVEELYAASVGESQVRVFARAYSADGRQNRAIAAGSSTAAGQGDYSIAPHYVAAYFESAALAELYGASIAISESTGAVSAASRAYSFRGELYDASRINRLHVNTSQKEVWVYIGDHHVG